MSAPTLALFAFLAFYATGLGAYVFAAFVVSRILRGPSLRALAYSMLAHSKPRDLFLFWPFALTDALDRMNAFQGMLENAVHMSEGGMAVLVKVSPPTDPCDCGSCVRLQGTSRTAGHHVFVDARYQSHQVIDFLVEACQAAADRLAAASEQEDEKP